MHQRLWGRVLKQMEPNFLGTPIVTSVMNSARETTVTVVVSTQESPGANMEEISNDNNPGTSVAENVSQSQVQTKNSEGVVSQTSNRTHKIDASTTMGVLSPSLSVPPVQVPATPLKLQQLLTQTHQQPTVESSSVVVQLPVSAPACSQSDPATISLPSSIPSVLHSQGMPAQPVVVQVGHQGRQQVTCVPSNQNVGLSGQRNQECHLLQPHASLMPSVVVQVAKGAQKVVPTPVVTQSGARVVPILPLYLQPAGGASGGLTAVMNPMPQALFT
ncbi:hypothetical protein J437_LFUL016969 [Ladona fulva]|uniref:Uncharacterized protein n=1 Tax=Ladona fulva TaxID=123851 RepID=A0A8K0KKT9_LADFU|nr:hypothetical protein J437_LFUL016969 [Ladona fulva]